MRAMEGEGEKTTVTGTVLNIRGDKSVPIAQTLDRGIASTGSTSVSIYTSVTVRFPTCWISLFIFLFSSVSGRRLFRMTISESVEMFLI